MLSSAETAASATAASAASAAERDLAVRVTNLDFTYGAATQHRVVLHALNLSLPRGSRTLLVGDNGAGKSTLLRLLAGKHIHPPGAVTVLGRESFYDTALNLKRAYLSTDWGRKTVACEWGRGSPAKRRARGSPLARCDRPPALSPRLALTPIPPSPVPSRTHLAVSGVSAMSVDVAVREMMVEAQAAFPERRARLVELLGIDLDWRMHQLSDGQRRRVQIMLQLLRPAELLLLDEITTDLDLITRQDFLNYLRDCAEEPRGGSGGTTIVYATHIFDGLDAWPTHIAYVGDGRLLRFGRVEEFADLQQRFRAGTVAPLLRTIEAWLREDRDARRAKGARMTEVAAALEESNLNELTGNGYLSGRFNAGYGN